MRITIQDVILVILPTIIGYGSQFICKIGTDSGKNVLFRPPSCVFSVVWPILFLLLGISCAVAANNAASNKVLVITTYTIVSLLLGCWIVVYGCVKSKKGSSWVLVLVIASELASFAQGSDVSKVMLAPLIAWSLFALIMNTTETQLNLN